MKALLALALLAASCATTSTAPIETPQVENGLTPYTLKKAPPVADYEIEDLAWLTGRWVGSGMGGAAEETWNPPMGGVMAGTFRLMDPEGNPNFYEFLTLLKDDEGIVLRLVHLSPDLIPWEEPGQTTDFRLVQITGTTAHFGGLTIHRDGDQMAIHVAMTAHAGGTSDVTFQFRLADA